MIVLHMGALHPVEQYLTLLLAFGPFALLGVVLWVRRRQDAAAEESTRQSAEDRARDEVAGG